MATARRARMRAPCARPPAASRAGACLLHACAQSATVPCPCARRHPPACPPASPPARTHMHAPPARTRMHAPPAQVAPITNVKTEYRLQLVHQIASNASYICYGLAKGHIRVLNKETTNRALLKGHNTMVRACARAWVAAGLHATCGQHGAKGLASMQRFGCAQGAARGTQCTWHVAHPACAAVRQRRRPFPRPPAAHPHTHRCALPRAHPTDHGHALPVRHLRPAGQL